MGDYLHGAYGNIDDTADRVPEESQGTIVYVGTAPIQMVAGGAANVNIPILINDISEAKKYFGYSDNFADYTLCEAMYAHFENKGVGPLVFINVLDLTAHKSGESGNITKTLENGRVVIPSAEAIIVDSIAVKAGDAAKVKDTDYTVTYNYTNKSITIAEAAPGKLGSGELKITYNTVDPSKVTADDVIGTTDGLGLNKGLFAIKDVYQVTGYIPSFIACPGFSSIPAVHSAMYQNSVKINGHWDAYMFVDLPITSEGAAVTFETAKTFKSAHGYTKENESVYFPLALGIDGRKYHISVLAAANFQELLLAEDGIPFNSASNTDCALIENLYLGEEYKGRIFGDDIINEKLNKNGIDSAAYVGGRWAIWGAHSADYAPGNYTKINVAETNRMMMYYVSNDFQHRRTPDIDRPLTPNDVKNIVSEEQGRLDALVGMGALTYGEVHLKADMQARSDIMNGDYVFSFAVTATPLAKSMTADVRWTDEGFKTYFSESE